jgi:hypothetical protein
MQNNPDDRRPLAQSRKERKQKREGWMVMAACPVCEVFRGEMCVRAPGEKGGKVGTRRQHVHRERKDAARRALAAARRKVKNPSRRSINDQVRFSRRRKSGSVSVRHEQPNPTRKRTRRQTVEDNLARLKREAELRRSA